MKIQHDPTGEYRCSEGTNCPWCGGLHYGSTVCPYSPAHKEKPWPKPAEGEREYFYRNKGEHLYHKCSDHTTLEALRGTEQGGPVKMCGATHGRAECDFRSGHSGVHLDSALDVEWSAEQGHKGATT